MSATSSNNFLGINVGSTRVAIAGDLCDTSSTGIQIPPAALLPVAPGEAAENAEPIGNEFRSIVGCGLPWPPAAQVDTHAGCGRFPAAYAWNMLHGPDRLWNWDLGHRQVSLHPADAIGTIVVGSLASPARSGVNATLVVPNTLGINAQERLLRSMRRAGLRPLLLWRPVAAALRWLKDHRERILNLDSGVEAVVGRFMSIHVGLDMFEADVLDLVSRVIDGRRWILPARRRPCVRTLFTWALTRAESANPDEPLANAWHRLWCQPWTLPATEGTGGFLGGSGESQLSTWRTQQGVLDVPIKRQASQRKSPREWFQEVLESEPGTLPILGIVVSGEFANVKGILDEHRETADLISDSLNPASLQVENSHKQSGGLLAEGALEFQRRHLCGEPTYLDTLPLIEMIAVRQGEPIWQPLVDMTDPYVMGGRVNRYEPEGLQFVLRADELQLTLSVAQEGFDHVREVSPEISAERKKDVPVRLTIEIAAGQGNPKVEVVSNDPSAFSGQRVFLDWDRAEDTGKTREQVIDEVPRTNPPHEPRKPSYACWAGRDGAKPVRLRMLRAVESLVAKRHGRARGLLAILREALRDVDPRGRNQYPPERATAFGSDGQLAEFATQTDVVGQFVEIAESLLASTRDDELRSELLRCLGYMSSDSPVLMKILRGQFRQLVDGSCDYDTRSILTAYGNCLRDPGDIANFAKVMNHVFSNGTLTGPSYWMRALCEMVRYRPDATEAIDSRIGEQLAWHCYRVAEAQVKADRSAKYLYRYGTLCIAFLLRRRRYDDGYMDPAALETIQIKDFMNSVANRIRRQSVSVLKGVVDPVIVTRMIVDYIDRRGRGRLIVEE